MACLPAVPIVCSDGVPPLVTTVAAFECRQCISHAGSASGQSLGKAFEAPAPVVPQEKARLAASLFGDSSAAEPARARRSPNKQVGHPSQSRMQPNSSSTLDSSCMRATGT